MRCADGRLWRRFGSSARSASGRKGESMKITERDNRPPGDEEWRRLVEAFEWLEDHCWVLPPEERWNPMIAPPKRDNPKLSDEERLRLAIDLGVKMAEADAL